MRWGRREMGDGEIWGWRMEDGEMGDYGCDC